MVRWTGFEPATFSLATKCSTELSYHRESLPWIDYHAQAKKRKNIPEPLSAGRIGNPQEIRGVSCLWRRFEAFGR